MKRETPELLSVSLLLSPLLVSNSVSLVVSVFSLGDFAVFPLVSVCCLTTSSWIHKHKLLLWCLLVSVWTLLDQNWLWTRRQKVRGQETLTLKSLIRCLWKQQLDINILLNRNQIVTGSIPTSTSHHLCINVFKVYKVLKIIHKMYINLNIWQINAGNEGCFVFSVYLCNYILIVDWCFDFLHFRMWTGLSDWQLVSGQHSDRRIVVSPL